MWSEFLSTNLGMVYVEANNYAHCGATSSDILNQVRNFPAPRQPWLSLYCLWTDSAPGDTWSIFLNAVTNEAAGNRLIQSEIGHHSNSVNQLYLKGARTILVQLYGLSTNAGPGVLAVTGTNSVLRSAAVVYIAR